MTASNKSVSLLSKLCSVQRDHFGVGAFVLTFDFEEGTQTTVRIALDDKQSGADMVITNMVTLPENVRGRGYGTKALRSLLLWAHSSKIETIHAVQVQGLSEKFWSKNHFRKMGNPTNDFQYSCRR